jgi:hypothetical protein
VLADNDLLFLDASVVPPTTSVQTVESSSAVPVVQSPVSAEISNAELYHRRLGHPGRTATKNLVRLTKIQAASAPLPDH